MALVEGFILSFVPVVKMIPHMLFFLFNSQSYLEHSVLTNKPSKSFFPHAFLTALGQLICTEVLSIEYFDSKQLCSVIIFVTEENMLGEIPNSVPVTCYL